LRIAIDARPLNYPTTGIGRYTGALLKRLRQSPHELLLYSHAPLDAEWHERARVRHGNLARPILSTAFAQAQFGRWARQDGADVFWSPRHHLPPALGDVPSVVTIHDLVWRLHPETMIRLGRLVESWLMPRALHRATRVIAVSEATANDVRELYPVAARKLVVIPEASDLDTARGCKRGEEPPYFLFVGTLEPRKNLANVIEAFTLVTRNNRLPHRLRVVGNPGWKSLQLTRALEQTPGVEWHGRVDDATLCDLYAGAYCVLVPSLYEGFALQIVEAMSFGIPVITSNVSAMPEVAGDAALLVDPYSVNAIAAAIRRVVEEPGLRDALAARAAVRSRVYSWESAAQATLEVLEAAATR
jgi:glycosyltransferase involved in cell wall biosynthesis